MSFTTHFNFKQYERHKSSCYLILNQIRDTTTISNNWGVWNKGVLGGFYQKLISGGGIYLGLKSKPNTASPEKDMNILGSHEYYLHLTKRVDFSGKFYDQKIQPLSLLKMNYYSLPNDNKI